MKIAVYALGALVALVLIAFITLLALGQRAGANHLSSEIEISESPDAVWAWVTEADRLEQWVSWLVEVEDLTPGVDGVGAKSIWHMDDPNMKERIQTWSEVAKYDENRFVEVNVGMDGYFKGTASYTLTDLGNDRTHLKAEFNYEYETFFGSLMEPLISPAARKKQIGDFARLKALAEADTGISAR